MSPKLSEPLAFEERFNAALVALESAYSAAIEQNSKTPKLSISNFLRSYKLSRSTLYENHPVLLQALKSKLIELQVTKADHEQRLGSNTSRRTSLEFRNLKNQMKEAIRKMASITMTDIIEQSGPAFRDRMLLMRERQAHFERIAQLEAQIAQRDSLIQLLTMTINKTNTE